MAVEARRGCGFRKIGGIYIVADGLSEPCERLPLPLLDCPTCGHGIKHSRGFNWITKDYLFAHAKPCAYPPGDSVDPDKSHNHEKCPVCRPGLLKADEPADRSGLIWIGQQHYSPSQWIAESLSMGVSRRVPAFPRGLVIGKTRVFAAHKHGLNMQAKLIEGAPETAKGDATKPAVIHTFVVKRVEVIVTESLLKREVAGQEKWLTKLLKQGATPVTVPEDDKDHAPKASKKSKRKEAMDRYAVEEEPMPKPPAKDEAESVLLPPEDRKMLKMPEPKGDFEKLRFADAGSETKPPTVTDAELAGEHTGNLEKGLHADAAYKAASEIDRQAFGALDDLDEEPPV